MAACRFIERQKGENYKNHANEKNCIDFVGKTA